MPSQLQTHEKLDTVIRMAAVAESEFASVE